MKRLDWLLIVIVFLAGTPAGALAQSGEETVAAILFGVTSSTPAAGLKCSQFNIKHEPASLVPPRTGTVTASTQCRVDGNLLDETTYRIERSSDCVYRFEVAHIDYFNFDGRFGGKITYETRRATIDFSKIYLKPVEDAASISAVYVFEFPIRTQYFYRAHGEPKAPVATRKVLVENKTEQDGIWTYQGNNYMRQEIAVLNKAFLPTLKSAARHFRTNICQGRAF